MDKKKLFQIKQNQYSIAKKIVFNFFLFLMYHQLLHCKFIYYDGPFFTTNQLNNYKNTEHGYGQIMKIVL